MKKIKNKYVKKIGLITFTLIVFALGIFNIKAEGTVTTIEDFKTKLADKNVSSVKLGADITTSESLTLSVTATEVAGHKKIIDLNGYNITVTGGNLMFSTGLYTDELQIVNTSSNSSIITAGWGIQINPERNINDPVDSYRNFKVVIKNVELKYPLTAYSLIRFNAISPAPGYTTIPRINLDVEINNSNLTGGINLFGFTKAINNTNFTLNNLSYTSTLETSKFYDGENVDITYNQILGTGQAYYVDDNLVGLDGSAKVEAAGYKHEIKAKEDGFSITPIKIDLTYGYTQADIEAAEVSVFIRNNYSESKTINKLQLSVPSDFIITGPETVTINPGEINSDFKIIANGLGKIVGNVNSSIEIKEGSDTIASANAVLEIKRAEYTFDVSLNNWCVGETPNEAVITGVPDEVSSIITPTYKYEGIPASSYPLSEFVPTEAGDYELTVRYDATGNYLASTSNVSFKILPGKELITTKELLGVNVYNYKEAFTLTDFSDFKIQIQKSGTDITLPYTVYTYNQPTSNFVGTTYVMIGIKISDDDYLKYEFNGGSQTLEHTYQIIIEGTTPEFTFSPNNINSSTDTSLSLTKRIASNLDLSGKVIVNNDKQDVVYLLAQDYAGKVLITDNKLQVASDFDGDLIEITASVAGVDLNGDSHNEYNENSTTIYVKMIDKTILTISGLDDNQTFDYDGNKKTPVGTILVQDNLLPTSDLVITYNGTGTTTYDSSDAPVNVGTYQVTYQINPTNSNYSGLVTYNFTISKSNPPYILPTDLTAKIGETLASVTLPTGFNWKDSSLVINEKTFKAFATYDSGNTNYNIIDVEITINANYYYDINTTVSGIGGTATSATGILEGTSYTINFNPDTGYQIDNVTVNGVLQTITDNNLILVVNENKDVIVKFKKIKYNINVDSPLGIILDKPGLTTVEYGDSFILNLKTELGYKLINVKVNGIDLTSTIIGDILSLTNISENKDITFNLEKIEYEVIKGSNQEVLINNKKDAEFQINAEVDLFEKVYIDGTILDPSNYTVTEGSTIITLKEAYLATLKNGKYVMTVLFSDGGNAKTNFTINRENETEFPKTTVPSTNVNNQETNPRTEDSISNYIILMITSLFAFLSTTYLLKKQKKEV